MRDSVPEFRLRRRALLAGSVALAAPALLSTRARAAEDRVVLATWGGDYARLLRENIDTPLLAPKGVKVVQTIDDEPPRIAQMIAQRMLPRGTFDVASLEAAYAYRLKDMNLLETLDESKIPNLKYVHPNLRTNFFVPHIYSPQVLIYDPKQVTAPTNFGDLLGPKYKGKVGFPTNNNFYVAMAASLYASGNVTDIEKAKALLIKLNQNGLRLYPETDSIAAAFKSKEINSGVMWLARVVMWQNAGISVAASFPKEGSVLYVSGFVVPKNAVNKQGAYQFLNAMLEPSAQQGFAAHMGYLPTVTNAPLSGKVAEQLALPNPAPRLVSPDYAYDAKETAPFNSWWQSKIQQG
ncbi:MAG: extracellular solute-binding protein [Rhodospirillales bacterium]|nr:extracellular solute-binding protein [Rhodospirillales bacterium]